MKKISTGNIIENVRKQPFNKASLEHIQEAFQEVFADMMKGLTTEAAGVVVLYGCVDSDPDPLDFNLSAGAVLYNGEVYRTPAFVGTHATHVPVLSLDIAYRAGDPVKFTDNNDFNVHEIRTLIWTMGVSGSGLVDFGALKRWKDNIKPASITALDGSLIRFKKMPLPIWNMETDAFCEITHGLPDASKIFAVHAMIRSDDLTGRHPLDSKAYEGGQGNGMVHGGWVGFTGVGSTEIYLVRKGTASGPDDGMFANAGYSNVSGAFSRGDMVISYYE